MTFTRIYLAAKSAVSACHYTKHGCCIDGITPCKGKNYEGCKNRGGRKARFVRIKRCKLIMLILIPCLSSALFQ